MGKQGKKISQQLKYNSGEINKLTPTKETVKKKRKLEAASAKVEPLPSTSSQGECKQTANVHADDDDIRLIVQSDDGKIGSNNNAVIGEQINLYEYNYAMRSKPLDVKFYNALVKNGNSKPEYAINGKQRTQKISKLEVAKGQQTNEDKGNKTKEISSWITSNFRNCIPDQDIIVTVHAPDDDFDDLEVELEDDHVEDC